jgi:hypothetical protein
MAKVLCEDGIERWRFNIPATLSDEEVELVRQAARARGLSFHAVLYTCFAQGLEALAEQVDAEADT